VFLRVQVCLWWQGAASSCNGYAVRAKTGGNAAQIARAVGCSRRFDVAIVGSVGGVSVA
jgi:hypothetical protein